MKAKTENNIVIGVPFVGHVNQDLRPTIDNAKDYLIKCFSGGYHSQLSNLMQEGKVRLMGYKYDFRPLMKKYVYKLNDVWHECYAPNKTLLRKSTYGTIVKIVEI